MLFYEDICWSDLLDVGGEDKAKIKPLTVTKNGMYTAPEGVVYSPVTVAVNGGPDDGGDLSFEDLTWDQIIASTQTGKYHTFEVGAMKELNLGSEGIVHMQIVGIDADDLADGSGKAHMTFISKELLETSHRMNPAKTPSSAPYDEGTGSIGGWEKCEMRSYLKETIKSLIPENVRNAIKNVKKYSNAYNASGTLATNVLTEDDLWIPSYREVFGGITCETSGPAYAVFSDANSRKRAKPSASYSSYWHLRSAYSASYFWGIKGNGDTSYSAAGDYGITIGFCL